VDYAAIAEVAGIFSVRVERPSGIRAAFTEALEHLGPALVDLVTDPNALSMPPHITGEQVKGFALTWSPGTTRGLRSRFRLEQGLCPRDYEARVATRRGRKALQVV
jgi:hypothetical protein